MAPAPAPAAWPALPAAQYFDTNYHYLVPELSDDSTPAPNWSGLLTKVERGQAAVGKERAVPILLGEVACLPARWAAQLDACVAAAGWPAPGCRLVPGSRVHPLPACWLATQADWPTSLESCQVADALPPHRAPCAGPNTLVGLARGEFDRSQLVGRVVPAYRSLLDQLRTLGVPEVQVQG